MSALPTRCSTKPTPARLSRAGQFLLRIKFMLALLRKRAAIGKAIVRDPKVFLFDDPLSNLDAELTVHMRVKLARLHRQLDPAAKSRRRSPRRQWWTDERQYYALGQPLRLSAMSIFATKSAYKLPMRSERATPRICV